MDVIIKDTPEGRAVLIRAEESLTFNMYAAFEKAARLASYSQIALMIVDLCRTREMFDSGVAMLLVLSKYSRRLQERIRLINASPEIRHQLSKRGLDFLFNVEESQGEIYPCIANTRARINRDHEIISPPK